MLTYQQQPCQQAYYQNPNLITPVSQQGEERLNELRAKKGIEIEAAIVKEAYLNDVRYDLLDRKIKLQEYRREVRKARYEEVVLGESGELKVQIRNTMIDIPQRDIANFKISSIYNLKSSQGEEGFLLLMMKINNREVPVYLDTAKMGRTDYFMRKINRAGGEIYTGSRRERENILRDLWVKLSLRISGTIIVPSCVGWISEEGGTFRFVGKEELLWEQVVKEAK